MKKRNKIIAGLVIGGAIASVLGMKLSALHKDNLASGDDVAYKDSVMKPKRKGIILRLLDWLEKGRSDDFESIDK